MDAYKLRFYYVDEAGNALADNEVFSEATLTHAEAHVCFERWNRWNKCAISRMDIVPVGDSPPFCATSALDRDLMFPSLANGSEI